jgi:hypothetical protein
VISHQEPGRVVNPPRFSEEYSPLEREKWVFRTALGSEERRLTAKRLKRADPFKPASLCDLLRSFAAIQSSVLCAFKRQSLLETLLQLIQHDG